MYTEYRNIYNKLIRFSKRNYFKDKLDKCNGRSRLIWKVINEAMNKSGVKSGEIESIEVNGQIITDKSEMADHFNEYFASIGRLTANEVDPTNINFESFLPTSSQRSIYLSPTVTEEVKEVIKNFKGKSSTDINNISMSLIKQIANEISSPLVHIFNLSFERGCVPEKFKMSKTVPVFKNTEFPQDMSHYRPISIINVFCKILEKLTFSRLMSFFIDTDFFYKSQFGFLEGRSTTHAILEMVDYISTALNNGEYCAGIYIDVKKAFDTVDHSLLIKKLENAGIRGIALDWFRSFLSNRCQRVKLGDFWSNNVKYIDISVLQGSILGALLFLVFINDLPRSNNAKNIMYADDTSAMCKEKSLDLLKTTTEGEMNKIALWFKANKLQINAGKTKLMLFIPKHEKIPEQFELIMNTNDPNEDDISKKIPVKRITESNQRYEDRFVKILGFHLDEKLTFKYHLEIVSKKISRSLFSINRVKHILPLKCLKSLYFALIHCHLNYCSIILSAASKTLIKPIIKLQKRAIRIISNSKYNDHTGETFIRLNILPVKALIEFNVLNFMYLYSKNRLPAAFCNTFPMNNYNRVTDYNLRNPEQLSLPRHRYESIKKFPLYLFPKAWNNLNTTYKYTTAKRQFQRCLKYDLLLKYTNPNNNCNEMGCNGVDCNHN